MAGARATRQAPRAARAKSAGDDPLLVDVVVQGCDTKGTCRKVAAKGKIDTGAQNSYLPKRVVQKLKLPKVGKTRIRGVTGTTTTAVYGGTTIEFPGRGLRPVPFKKLGINVYPTDSEHVLLSRQAMSGGDDKRAAMLLRYNAATGRFELKNATGRRPARERRRGREVNTEKNMRPKRAKKTSKRGRDDVEQDGTPPLSAKEAKAIAEAIAGNLRSVGTDALAAGAQAAGSNSQSAKAIDNALRQVARTKSRQDREILESAASWFHYHANLLADLDRDDVSAAGTDSRHRGAEEAMLQRMLSQRAPASSGGRGGRGGERGFVTVENMIATSVAVVGVVAAPQLNKRIDARPLGQYVTPSAGASVVSLVAGMVARRAGYKKTGKAGISLGVGLAVGTLVSAKSEGGVMAPK